MLNNRITSQYTESNGKYDVIFDRIIKQFQRCIWYLLCLDLPKRPQKISTRTNLPLIDKEELELELSVISPSAYTALRQATQPTLDLMGIPMNISEIIP